MNISYRTKDGAHDYGFDLLQMGPRQFRVYITRQPGYAGRPTDAVSTHRLRDPAQRQYVCWAGTVPSMDAAKSLAASWAENTEEYIATGRFGSRMVTDWR